MAFINEQEKQAKKENEKAGGTGGSEKGNKSEDSKSELGEGGSGGNWMLQLARALAKIQNKFLDHMMQKLSELEDVSKMGDKLETDEHGNKKGEGAQRAAFMRAQTEFQGAQQMFNLFANLSSTSLKVIGEGCTTLATKR